MVLHPAAISLVTGSVLTSSMFCLSSYYSVKILRYWDMGNGSEIQLDLERKTYLISTLMSYVFGFQLFSLFLFIHTADNLSSLFVGAMCAAGSLNVNAFGYPTIVLKIGSFVLAGLWLIVNYTDNRAHDYPLIRVKYAMLLAITPLQVAEAITQGAYLLGLEPNVITSCCGALFSAEAGNIASGIIALPCRLSETAFFSSAAATLALGVYFYLREKGAYLFSVSSLITFLASIAALISFISVYFYELPTHHCPFCLLHREYGYVGYGIYTAILSGGVAGLGVGVLEPFQRTESLLQVLPRIQRQLASIAVLSFCILVLIVIYGIAWSNLTLKKY
jgi:hypothetical protein